MKKADIFLNRYFIHLIFGGVKNGFIIILYNILWSLLEI